MALEVVGGARRRVVNDSRSPPPLLERNHAPQGWCEQSLLEPLSGELPWLTGDTGVMRVPANVYLCRCLPVYYMSGKVDVNQFVTCSMKLEINFFSHMRQKFVSISMQLYRNLTQIIAEKRRLQEQTAGNFDKISASVISLPDSSSRSLN